MQKNIRTWAHPMWSYIHSLPNLSGPNREERIACIFALLVSIIPCDTCSEHSLAWMQKYPPYNVLPGGFGLYFYNLHNSVNLRTYTQRANRSVLTRYRMEPSYSLSRLSSAILKFRSDDYTRAVLVDVEALTVNSL